MKNLLWKIILPATIISFVLFTKWWYVHLDGPERIMIGFPLIWVTKGFHTSMSVQVFVLEFLIDLVVYFLFWFTTIFIINKFIISIKPYKIVAILLWILSSLIIFGSIMVGTMPDHLYLIKRNFDIEVMETGYKFIWQKKNVTDFNSVYQHNNSP